MKLGFAFREIREAFGAKQRAMADMLGVTSVHLCNVEADKSVPSPSLCDRLTTLTGIDPYVYAWAITGNVDRLPKSIQNAARKFQEAMRDRVVAGIGELTANK